MTVMQAARWVHPRFDRRTVLQRDVFGKRPVGAGLMGGTCVQSFNRRPDTNSPRGGAELFPESSGLYPRVWMHCSTCTCILLVKIYLHIKCFGSHKNKTTQKKFAAAGAIYAIPQIKQIKANIYSVFIPKKYNRLYKHKHKRKFKKLRIDLRIVKNLMLKF